MKKIGIIAAMNEEMQEIKNIMENVTEKNIFNLKFFEGKINGKDCVLVECGIGKVNAARTTQVMIDSFNLEYIINIGTAGATSNSVNTLDVVIGEKLFQHDFDLVAFGHEKGFIPGVGMYVEADKMLVNRCKEAIENLSNNNYDVHIGTIASGDVFCTDPQMAQNLYKEYNTLCVEMEGAAIGQIAYLDNIPFIVIRSISDSPNGKNHIDFDDYLQIASKRGAEFLKNII